MRSGGGQAGRRQLEQPDASRRAIASAGTPSPEPSEGSMAESAHHVLPEDHRLSVTRIAGLLLANGRVDHHQPALRVDEDPLAPHAEEREPPLLARKYPGLVAVAETWRRAARPQVVLVRMLAGGVSDPRGGDDLAAPPVSVVGEQETEPRVVAQHRVEAAIGRLLAGAVDQPRRIRLGAHRLPDLLLQVLDHRPAERARQHQPEHLGLDRGVIEARAARPDSLIELFHRLLVAIRDPGYPCTGQPHDISQ